MKATRNRTTLAMILMSSAAVLGGITSGASAETDVRITYNNGGCSYGYTSTAGILVVDGRRFTIYSSRDIGGQIVGILRRCGYDASIDCGKVVVCYDRGRAPNVCWYQRGYSATISQSRGMMGISWCKIQSSRPSFTSGNWGWSSDHGWGRGRDRGCAPAHSGRNDHRGKGGRRGDRGGHRGGRR